MDERKDATAATKAAHAALAASLPADTGEDFANARRGFLGTIPDANVPGAWSMAPFAFLEDERPDTVNPSLWRQARLNNLHGLFQVTEGVYQVRGFDLSNITFIEGERGYVIVDPLTSAAPAAAALK
ncbi:MAG TPA: MBL fold metallo-hydrolase, partial [Phenylobacterium sp.]|nr:MBL fold metallo-hydrolase [Phenylobacterium sp.]